MYFNDATWLAASWGTGQEEMPMESLKQEQVRHPKTGEFPEMLNARLFCTQTEFC